MSFKSNLTLVLQLNCCRPGPELSKEVCWRFLARKMAEILAKRLRRTWSYGFLDFNGVTEFEPINRELLR